MEETSAMSRSTFDLDCGRELSGNRMNRVANANCGSFFEHRDFIRAKSNFAIPQFREAVGERASSSDGGIVGLFPA